MTTLVIKSNHGNHTGFNRKWDILNSGYPFDTREDAIAYLDKIIDECENDIEEGERTSKGLEGYEYHLYYYYVVTQDEYDDNFFNGGHHGYASQQIINLFEKSNSPVS